MTTRSVQEAIIAQIRWVAGFRGNAVKPGSFRQALIEAVFRADVENLERLRRGFPEVIEAFEAYRGR